MSLSKKDKDFISKMERLPIEKYPTLPIMLAQFKVGPSENFKSMIMGYLKDVDASAKKATEEERDKTKKRAKADVRKFNEQQRDKFANKGDLVQVTMPGTRNKVRFYQSRIMINNNIISCHIVLEKTFNAVGKLYSRITAIIKHIKSEALEKFSGRQIQKYNISFPYFSIYRADRRYVTFAEGHLTSLKRFKKELERMKEDKDQGGSDVLQEEGVNNFIANNQVFTIRIYTRPTNKAIKHSIHTPDKYCIWFGKDDKIVNCGYIRKDTKKEVNCVIDFLFKYFRCFARELYSCDDQQVNELMEKLESQKDESLFFTEDQLYEIQSLVDKYYKKDNACKCENNGCNKTFSLVENALSFKVGKEIDQTLRSSYSEEIEGKDEWKIIQETANNFFDPVVLSRSKSDKEICMILDRKLKHIFCFKGDVDQLYKRKIRDEIKMNLSKDLYIEVKNKKKMKKHYILSHKKEVKQGKEDSWYSEMLLIMGFDYESICDFNDFNLVKPFLSSFADMTFHEFLAFGIINIVMSKAVKKGLKKVDVSEIRDLVNIIKKKYPSSGQLPVNADDYDDEHDDQKCDDEHDDPKYEEFAEKIRVVLFKLIIMTGERDMVDVDKTIINTREIGLVKCKTFLSYDCTYEMLKHVYEEKGIDFNDQNRVGCFLGFNNSCFDNFIMSHDLHKCRDRLSSLIDYQIQIDSFVHAGQMLGLKLLTNAQIFTHDVRKYLTSGSLASLCKDYGLVIFEKQKLEDEITHVEMQHKYNELGPKEFLKYVATKKEYIDYCRYDTLSTMLLFSVFTITMHEIDTTDIVVNKMRVSEPETYDYRCLTSYKEKAKHEDKSDDYNPTKENAVTLNKLISNTFRRKTIGSFAVSIQNKYWEFIKYKPATLNLKWYEKVKPNRVAGRVDKFAKSGRYDEKTNLLDNIITKDELLTTITRLSLSNHAKKEIMSLADQLLHSFDMCGQYQYVIALLSVYFPGGENCRALEVLPKEKLDVHIKEYKAKLKEEDDKKKKDDKYKKKRIDFGDIAGISLEDLDDIESGYYHICNESHIFEMRSVEDGKKSPTPHSYNKEANKRKHLGWFECDVDQEILRYRNLPYFVAMKTKDGNDFEKGYIKNAVLTNVEISYIRSLGCEVKIKDGILFTQSRRSYELFKPQLVFMDIKNKQDLIKKGKLSGEYNASQREIGKLIPNSITGKLNEMIHLIKSSIISCAEYEKKRKDIEKRNKERMEKRKEDKKDEDEDEDEDEEMESISIIDMMEDGSLYVEVKDTTERCINQQYAMGMGGFIYAYARIFMFEYVYKYIGLLASLYADTDCIKGYSNAFEEWKKIASNMTIPHWRETEEYDPRYRDHPLYIQGSKLFGGFEDEMKKFNKKVKFDNGDKVISYALQKKTWAYIHYDKDGKVLNAKMRAKGVSPTNAIIRLDEIPDLPFLKYDKNDVLVLDVYNVDGSINIDKYKQFSDYTNNPKNQLYYGAKNEDDLDSNIEDPNKYDNIDYFFACAHEINTAYVIGTSFTRNVRNPRKNVQLGEYNKYFDKTGTLTLRCVLKKIVPRPDQDKLS